MKRLLLISALALTSCAPLLSTVQGDSATLTRTAAGVVFDNPASTPAQDVAVLLHGDVTVTGATCHAVGTNTGCTLGDVPAGQKSLLVTAGPVPSGSATFYRPGSDRPILTVLKGE